MELLHWHDQGFRFCLATTFGDKHLLQHAQRCPLLLNDATPRFRKFPQWFKKEALNKILVKCQNFVAPLLY